MKIREGAYYRTRGGDVVGPMRHDAPGSRHPWQTLNHCWTKGGAIFAEEKEHVLDLISEVYVSDTPPADAPAPETKTLRDEFASEAMKKLMDTSGLKAAAHHDEANRIGLGKLSYGIADAMMEARKK